MWVQQREGFHLQFLCCASGWKSDRCGRRQTRAFRKRLQMPSVHSEILGTHVVHVRPEERWSLTHLSDPGIDVHWDSQVLLRLVATRGSKLGRETRAGLPLPLGVNPTPGPRNTTSHVRRRPWKGLPGGGPRKGVGPPWSFRDLRRWPLRVKQFPMMVPVWGTVLRWGHHEMGQQSEDDY